jgi:hypothetical protein
VIATALARMLMKPLSAMLIKLFSGTATESLSGIVTELLSGSVTELLPGASPNSSRDRHRIPLRNPFNQPPWAPVADPDGQWKK